MKKVIFMFAIAAVISASSCKKASTNTCYVCTVGGTATPAVCTNTYTASQISAYQTACTGGGGTWSTQ